MEDIILFCVEVGFSLIASFLVLVYLGSLLRQMLIDLCGTEERASFWLGFSKLIFIFLPLLIVVFYSDNEMTVSRVTAQMLRETLSKVLFGELVALCMVGFVLWRSISSKSRYDKSAAVPSSAKGVA